MQDSSPDDGIGAKLSGSPLFDDLPGSDCGGVCQDGTSVLSTRWRSPRFNLKWSLQLGTWNVLSLREDDHLSLLSSELKHLDSGIAALSEVWRLQSGEIMVGD